MTTTEWEHQLVAETQGLSADLLSEIVDFIQFLKMKKGNNSPHKQLGNMSYDEMQHLDEEFINYKVLYPAE